MTKVNQAKHKSSKLEECPALPPLNPEMAQLLNAVQSKMKDRPGPQSPARVSPAVDDPAYGSAIKALLSAVSETPDIVTRVDATGENLVVAQQTLQDAIDIAEANGSTLYDIAPWPDAARGLPNDLARSSLFTTRSKRIPRRAYDRTSLFHTHSGVHIHYTGIELRAENDLLVFLQVLECAKRTPLGQPVSFSLGAMVEACGWSRTQKSRQWVENCLLRLTAGSIGIECQRLGTLDRIGLLGDFRIVNRGSRNSRCFVKIDARILALFAKEHYTRGRWEIYRKLTPTALRLCINLMSHAKPFPLRLDSFKAMCDSDCKSDAKWRQQVRAVCTELNATGLFESVWIEANQIKTRRADGSNNPTNSAVGSQAQETVEGL